MQKRDITNYILILFVVVSFIIKVILIFKYQNQLTLSSDDLNYVKSAVTLLKKGILTYHNFNELTVFIMPLYPIFLAVIFKIFGYGLIGLQAVRLIQAILSCITIVMVFKIGKFYFSNKIGIIAAFFVSFYIPNIVSVGYLLTETIFTTLLCILLYLSLVFCRKPGILKFSILGLVWTLSTLCRPTIALYPIMLFFYLISYLKVNVYRSIKLGAAMFGVFLIVMLPWWVRNYQEYGEFVPLAASSGNPMLQGTYINYRQTPENIVYYNLGRNAFETNKTEVAAAKQRIKAELNKDFWGYMRWTILGKTYYLWKTTFYWKMFFGIPGKFVQGFHYILLTGFLGIIILLFSNFTKFILPVSVILYFNAVHCYYMAFDRYAFPLLPIVSIFTAYSLYSVYLKLKSLAAVLVKADY
jgi:4-amino-4-deoxy-L-arabinose transferase-like glycosyltransferase